VQIPSFRCRSLYLNCFETVAINSAMKIAIYSHSILPTVDGVARRFTQIIEELISQGHEVVLFTLESTPQKIPKCVRYYTLRSCSIPNYPGKLLGMPTLVNLYTICVALHHERPDIIHCVADALSASFGLLGRSMGIPVVSSIHTDLQTLGKKTKVPTFGRKMANFKEMADARLLDGCATTSYSFMEQLHKQGIKCDHAIKTAVNIRTFSPKSYSSQIRERLTFGNSHYLLAVFVGRLAPEKRLDFCLRLLEKVENMCVAFIGDGPMGSKLAQFHGPEYRVYCKPGFMSHAELAEVYASADVHLSASKFETLGNTVLESHACGTPVVVPRTQGFKDTVSHGEDGFLFDVLDTVPDDVSLLDAAEYLKKLRDDRELCKEMGQNGREKVTGNTKELVVKDIMSWYHTSMDRYQKNSQIQLSFQCLQLAFLVILSIFFCHICESTFPALLFMKNKYLQLKKTTVRKIDRARGIERVCSKYEFDDV